MKHVRWILAAMALAVCALPAVAEEILFLKSGSAMPVVSHRVDGEMIHVDLGDNAFMAFPMSMVDRIERAGKHVMLDRSNTGGTNVMRPKPDPTGSFPVRGSAQSRRSDKNRFDEEQNPDAAVETDERGVAVYRPYGNSSHPGKRRVGYAYDERILNNSGAGYRGATPVGNRQVIGARSNPRKTPAAGGPPALTGIAFQPKPHSPGGAKARDGEAGPRRDSGDSSSGSGSSSGSER
jgi:hypothetical protein